MGILASGAVVMKAFLSVWKNTPGTFRNSTYVRPPVAKLGVLQGKRTILVCEPKKKKTGSIIVLFLIYYFGHIISIGN